MAKLAQQTMEVLATCLTAFWSASTARFTETRVESLSDRYESIRSGVAGR